jgi:hypothetical protein
VVSQRRRQRPGPGDPNPPGLLRSETECSAKVGRGRRDLLQKGIKEGRLLDHVRSRSRSIGSWQSSHSSTLMTSQIQWGSTISGWQAPCRSGMEAREMHPNSCKLQPISDSVFYEQCVTAQFPADRDVLDVRSGALTPREPAGLRAEADKRSASAVRVGDGECMLAKQRPRVDPHPGPRRQGPKHDVRMEKNM